MKQLIAAAIVFSITTIALSASSVHAQTRHELIRGDMPPGLAADYYRMNNPKLEFHVQPVRVISPTRFARRSRIEKRLHPNELIESFGWDDDWPCLSIQNHEHPTELWH